MSGSPDKRFWAKVVRKGPDECWGWTAAKCEHGYGMLWVGSAFTGAHRFSYALHVGPIPAGAHILHHCDNPECTNPAHLYAGTAKDNAADKERRHRGNHATGDRNGARARPERLARGDRNGSRLHPESRPRGDQHGSRLHPESRPRGEQHKNAKLTAAQVREIRADSGRHRDIAARYQVSRSLVSTIKRGEAWRSI